jgi:hypothetical protein
MVCNTQNYLVFGRCLSSGVIETRKHNISETGSVSVLSWRGEAPTLLRPFLSSHLRTETGPVSETLCFIDSRTPGDGQSPKTKQFWALTHVNLLCVCSLISSQCLMSNDHAQRLTELLGDMSVCEQFLSRSKILRVNHKSTGRWRIGKLPPSCYFSHCLDNERSCWQRKGTSFSLSLYHISKHNS